MSKRSRNGCGWECCPSGFIEHVKHYRYLRQVTEITLVEYWWYEFKSLLGFNGLRKKPKNRCDYCGAGECYEHNYFSPEFFED